jgi:hypothetical protein
MTAAVVAVELALTEGPVSGTVAVSYAGAIIWQAGERTGTHRCVVCVDVVAREEYFRNDHACDACGAEERYPFAGDQLSGFRPIDRPEVRAAIEGRGAA